MHIILFTVLTLIFPVGVYCLILAVLNARDHPTIVSGPWDFAGVLLAASGVLIIGGPFVLMSMNVRWRTAVILGRVPGLPRGDAEGVFWLALWALYFLVLVGGAAALLWRRRTATVIYNVQRPLLDLALGQAFEQLGLETKRVADRIQFSRRVALVAATPEGKPESTAFSTLADRNGGAASRPAWSSEDFGALEIEFFTVMHNATLQWGNTEPRLRRDVEAELARAFAALPAPETPVGGWFMTTATCLFGSLFLAFLVFLLSRWTAR